MKPKNNVSGDDANLNQKIQKTGELLHLCSQKLPKNPQLLWSEHLTIRRILAEISVVENLSTDIAPSRRDFLAPFEKWCSEIGILAAEIKISSDDDQNFGLYTQENVNFESILAEIPSKAILTCDFAKKSDLKSACEKDPILKEMPNVVLSICILNEKLKAGESKWKPYIDFLPKVYTTPLYFTISEIEFLKNTFIYEDSLKLYRNVARQYAYFSQILSNEKNYFEKTAVKLENFTFDLYRWATSTVMTRVNLCQNLPVLIPFLDMANHDPRLEESLDYDENRGKVVLYAARNFEKDQEIRIFYGKRTNGEFLMNNGFVDPAKNPFDAITINLALSKNDTLYESKFQLLTKLGLTSNKNAFSIPTDIIYCPQRLNNFLHFALIFYAENNLKNLQAEKFDFESLDPETRKKCSHFLSDRLNLLLKVREKALKTDQKTPVSILNLLESEKYLLEKAIDARNRFF